MSQRAPVGENKKPDRITEKPQHTRGCRQDGQAWGTPKNDGGQAEREADEHIQHGHRTCSAQRCRREKRQTTHLSQ